MQGRVNDDRIFYFGWTIALELKTGNWKVAGSVPARSKPQAIIILPFEKGT